MATRSNSSRERILSCAESIILQKGFSATSIEDIIDKAAITKSGFFYHFETKSVLAQALVDRYLKQDDEIFADLMGQAEQLSEDPLHRLLIFLKLLSDQMAQMEQTHPGCLVASFTYESHQFHSAIKESMKTGLMNWRKLILGQIEQINLQYPVDTDVSMETLADMFTGTIEGGIMLARAFENNQLLVDQILAYRSFLRMLYGAR